MGQDASVGSGGGQKPGAAEHAPGEYGLACAVLADQRVSPWVESWALPPALPDWLRITRAGLGPEGGCALAATRRLREEGRLSRDAEVVIFNTGSGASYRA